MAVDGRVDAQAKDVLVVLGQRARVDEGAPGRRGLAVVMVDDGDDAGGARLDGDAGGLVEDERKDVLVVGEGEDVLDDELAAAGDDGAAGAPVGVLPADAVVLLVQADDVFGLGGRAVRVGEQAVKVLGGGGACVVSLVVHRGGTIGGGGGLP